MQLEVLGSSSLGNCYFLKSEKETLIIECGIKFEEIKRALNYNISNVCGCLVTHEHKDHCKSIENVMEAGIDVFLSEGTAEELNIKGHRINILKPLKLIQVGEFKVFPFDTKHDSKEPLGFLIQHEEMGTLLFATDTYYIEYKFNSLDHILIECNYSLKILKENVEQGKIPGVLKDRVMKSHFELENVKEFFKANDLSNIKNIMLLHLSGGNSNPEQFKKEIEELSKKKTYIATKGLVLEVNKHPF